MRIALLCGGPSPERGISLNSARSVLDHLSCEESDIIPIYFDIKKNAYKISHAQLYSNTPSDFDFKLQQTAVPLTQIALKRLLKNTDLVFPVIHGQFGEDGEIQTFLQKHDIPFVGSDAQACKKAFDKFNANEYIKQHGFFTNPSALLKIYHDDHRTVIEHFFATHHIQRAIVKPATGGSSIGVFSVSSPEQALEKAQLLFSKRMDTRVVIEPFVQGTEFTIIILENRFGLPIALPPTEIETDYTKNQIFDFRRKYLPTRQVTWHCPPRFDNLTIEHIQAQAEQLFALFGMHDFGRFDGWVLPDGTLWFCDFNPISGMEQNSFLFQQASRIGMTHEQVLRHIIESSCRRFKIQPPQITKHQQLIEHKQPIYVLFGGSTSERQVSLLSGTNVWLKLRGSKKYNPQPFLLDTHKNIWHLPYHLTLNHTVEEIMHNCNDYENTQERLKLFEQRARLRLGLLCPKNTQNFFKPYKMTLEDFIKQAPFVFNALHGGEGEDGTLQSLLEKNNIAFNGPDQHVSRLCMDKWATTEYIKKLNTPGINTIAGMPAQTASLLALNTKELKLFWKALKKKLGAHTIIVKPRTDGCSSGVVHLYSSTDLAKYLHLCATHASFIPSNTCTKQKNIIEMPTQLPHELIFERFIETDLLRVKNNILNHRRKSGWLEITSGVIGVDGKMTAFNPSITVAEGEVLSVEEKFQGGTGINLTPPPTSIIKPRVRKIIKERIQILAQALGITGYSRIDAFAHIVTGDLLIIEVNTLPALTPSTVLYQQALAEQPALFPRDLLHILISNKTEPIIKEPVQSKLINP